MAEWTLMPLLFLLARTLLKHAEGVALSTTSLTEVKLKLHQPDAARLVASRHPVAVST